MKAYDLVVLPKSWIQKIVGGPSDRGDYQFGKVKTKDGNIYKCLMSNFCYIMYTEGYDYIPFSEDDIKDIFLELYTIEWWDANSKKIEKRGKYLYENNILREPLPIKSVPRKNE